MSHYDRKLGARGIPNYGAPRRVAPQRSPDTKEQWTRACTVRRQFSIIHSFIPNHSFRRFFCRVWSFFETQPLTCERMAHGIVNRMRTHASFNFTSSPFDHWHVSMCDRFLHHKICIETYTTNSKDQISFVQYIERLQRRELSKKIAIDHCLTNWKKWLIIK